MLSKKQDFAEPIWAFRKKRCFSFYLPVVLGSKVDDCVVLERVVIFKVEEQRTGMFLESNMQ